MTVEVLDLDRFAGGLRPVSKGGGFQTKSLRLAAPDGHEFFFRSVDKDPAATLPPELRGTIAASVVRDQTKAAFPTAPLVVDRLLTAVGILHAKTRLVVLPREGLGEFSDKFGGLMGTLDERVGGVEGPSSHWHGALEIIGTDSLFARANRSPDDQLDAPAFLTARLFDVLMVTGTGTATNGYGPVSATASPGGGNRFLAIGTRPLPNTTAFCWESPASRFPS